MRNESTDILRFHDVTIAADREYKLGMCNLNSSLAAGALVVVLLEKEQLHNPLADAAEGLVSPVQGTVTFLGEDWQTMALDRAAAQRGRIGRVFEGDSWRSGITRDAPSRRSSRRRPNCAGSSVCWGCRTVGHRTRDGRTCKRPPACVRFSARPS
jgi:hypothetical protein